MKKIFFIAALLLAGCGTVDTYYNQGNYEALPWASTSFDQTRAKCRSDNLQHEWVGDSYELAVPKFKACMEKEGFRYQSKI